MSNTIFDIATILTYLSIPSFQSLAGKENQEFSLSDLQLQLKLLLKTVDLNEPDQTAGLSALMQAYQSAWEQATPLERLQAEIVVTLQTMDSADHGQVARLSDLIAELVEVNSDLRLLPQYQSIYDNFKPSDPESLQVLYEWALSIRPTTLEGEDIQFRLIAELKSFQLGNPAAGLRTQYVLSLFLLELQKSSGVGQQQLETASAIAANYKRVS